MQHEKNKRKETNVSAAKTLREPNWLLMTFLRIIFLQIANHKRTRDRGSTMQLVSKRRRA